MISIHNNEVIVDANLPFNALIEETIQHDFIPPVIPDAPMSVAQAVTSFTAQASSHKYGTIHDTCHAIKGKIECSPKKNKELFQALATSYGTLMEPDQVTLQLIPYAPGIDINIHPCFNWSESMELLKSKADTKEIIVFSLHEIYVLLGRYTSKKGKKLPSLNAIKRLDSIVVDPVEYSKKRLKQSFGFGLPVYEQIILAPERVVSLATALDVFPLHIFPVKKQMQVSFHARSKLPKHKAQLWISDIVRSHKAKAVVHKHTLIKDARLFTDYIYLKEKYDPEGKLPRF